MNIFIGNLSYEVSDEDLKTLFSQFGSVISAKVIVDSDTGQSRGFGFVELESKDQGQKAIAGLNGVELKGRTVKVNEARPRADRGGRRGRW